MNESFLTINSIGDLQIALLEDNNNAIKNYIERLDRESSNEAMTRAGEQFAFPIVEIEGVIRTSGGHLAQLFGYKQTHSLTDLLLRRGISGIKVAGFTHDAKSLIREKLSLGDKDYSAILYDWPAFLVGGMNSTNEEAKAVQAYLLRMEKIARIGIIATRSGQLMANFPDPTHGIVMSKLAKEAWRGNPIASYILEKHYDVPVKQLLHRTDPELSEIAGTISQYLHFLFSDRITSHGLQLHKTERGCKIIGEPDMFYRSFLEVARRHHVSQFFSSVFSLGAIMSREADAIDMLGWRRSVRKINGYNRYTYEYEPPERSDQPAIGMN
jgi:hypothetical protein